MISDDMDGEGNDCDVFVAEDGGDIDGNYNDEVLNMMIMMMTAIMTLRMRENVLLIFVIGTMILIMMVDDYDDGNVGDYND